MPTPKKQPLKPIQKVMIVLLVLVGLLIAAYGVRMLQPYLQKTIGYDMNVALTMNVAPQAMDMGESYGGSVATSRGKVVSGTTGIVAPYPPVYTPPAGDTSEEFEVTNYNASIETQNLEEACGKIFALKSRKDVIFQNSDENERNCNYSFKVTKEKANEVLDLLKSMDPKTLNENVYTIKKILESYDSQEVILKRKEEAIQATLKSATADYDAVAALARSTKDTESLTKIMNSKIDLIQRLTNESIQNNAQLEQLARDKAEQADQLVYTNFYVSIVEDTYVNGRDLKESWEQAVKDVVMTINTIAQTMTVGLVALAFMLIQYIIYFVILLFVAKYGWQFTKKVWRSK